ALTSTLACSGTLEYTALVPAHHADAASGLQAVEVRERLGLRRGAARIASMGLSASTSRSLRRAEAALDILHFPLTVPIPRSRLPAVVTLHDLQHHDLPE